MCYFWAPMHERSVDQSIILDWMCYFWAPMYERSVNQSIILDWMCYFWAPMHERSVDQSILLDWMCTFWAPMYERSVDQSIILDWMCYFWAPMYERSADQPIFAEVLLENLLCCWNKKKINFMGCYTSKSYDITRWKNLSHNRVTTAQLTKNLGCVIEVKVIGFCQSLVYYRVDT